LDGSRRVLVAATPVTVKGEKLRLLLSRIDHRHLVDCIALPRLVTFAEREEFRSESVTGYLREALAPFRLEDYSAFVLGCTHFNYFKDTLRALLPTNVCFVDGNAGAVRELIHELGGEAALPQAGESRTRCYYSGRPVTDEATLAHIARCMKRLDEVYALA
ncbi:MAG: glutamate racemase, partial [Mitsuokella sp.]